MNFAHLLSDRGPFGWKFYGNPLPLWIAFVLGAVLLYGGLMSLRRISATRVGVIAALTGAHVEELIANLIAKTNALFLLTSSLYVACLLLYLPPRAEEDAHIAFSIILLCQTGIWLNHAVSWGLQEFVENHHESQTQAGLATAVSALRFLSRVAVWSIVILLVLSNLRINVTTLIAGLGVGGVAVALALQNILGDLFASLSILLDKPFAVGHPIEVDGLVGTVEYVGVKSTRIRSVNGEELVVANGDLLKSRIHNYANSSERRVVLAIGVNYDITYAKLEKIQSTVREIIAKIRDARFDRAHFKNFGNSSLDFEIAYFVKWTNYRNYMDVQHAVNLAIFKKFAEDGIEFASATNDLYVHLREGAPSLGEPAPDEIESSLKALQSRGATRRSG